MIDRAKMIRDGYVKETTISRICAFCGTYEQPQADVGNLTEVWACERCKAKLKAVLEQEG